MEDNFGIIAWLLLPVNSTQGKYGLPIKQLYMTPNYLHGAHCWLAVMRHTLQDI